MSNETWGLVNSTVRFYKGNIMTNNIYETPNSNLNEIKEESQKVSLSQSSGKKKIFVGVPVSLICGFLAFLGVLPGITKMLSIVLAGYAIVGIIEVIGGNALALSAKKWDMMPSWKKFIISITVILIAVVGFIAVLPIVAKFV